MRHIGFVLSPGFQVMSFAALSVFEYANKEMGEAVYDVRLLSETGESIRSSIGVSVATEPLGRRTASLREHIRSGGRTRASHRPQRDRDGGIRLAHCGNHHVSFAKRS